MISPYETIYTPYVYDENGQQHNITDYVTALGWEQNPGELATRVSLTAKDGTDGKLSSRIKPGCLIVVTAKTEVQQEEVARGYITDWNPVDSFRERVLRLIAYDELFNLQKSEGQIYISSGENTRTVISGIFSGWGIPMGTYNGPEVKHGKLMYDTENIAEVLYDVLDDADKKGGGKALLRAEKGKVSVLRWGSNKDVWLFTAENALEANHKITTDGMLTRVIVLGKSENSEKSPLEATVNGKTQYGIRQKIYKRQKDENLGEAKQAAQKILEESGDPKTEITVTAPDVPFIRKGDKVYMDKVGRLDGYYFVRGIRHDIIKRTMTMDLSEKEGED